MRLRTLAILGAVWSSSFVGIGTACAHPSPSQPDSPPDEGEAPPAERAGSGFLVEAQRFFWQGVDEISKREPWSESEGAEWRFAFSPYTQHYRYSPEHRPVYAFALELQRKDGWMAGGSLFRNSFGQGSTYGYLGRRFENLLDEPWLFGQVTAGMLYGYRGHFQHKVPLNARGFSPGALVSVGWQANSCFSVVLHMLGDAGVMLQFAAKVP